MKQLVISTVIGLLLSTTVFAQITVLQDGKKMFFKEDAQIIVSGKTPATVLFNGVIINVPAGQKVQIQKKDGNIWISGTNMKEVEAAGKKISSNGHAIVAISPDTKKVTSVRGDINIARDEVVLARDNSRLNNKRAVNETISNESISFPEVSEYVNEVVSQQSVQDVTDMSLYAPRP